MPFTQPSATNQPKSPNCELYHVAKVTTFHACKVLLFSLILYCAHMLIVSSRSKNTQCVCACAMRKHLRYEAPLVFVRSWFHDGWPPHQPPHHTLRHNNSRGKTSTYIHIYKSYNVGWRWSMWWRPDDDDDDYVGNPKKTTKVCTIIMASWWGNNTMKWLCYGRSCSFLLCNAIASHSKVIMQIAKAYHWNGTRNVGRLWLRLRPVGLI